MCEFVGSGSAGGVALPEGQWGEGISNGEGRGGGGDRFCEESMYFLNSVVDMELCANGRLSCLAHVLSKVGIKSERSDGFG